MGEEAMADSLTFKRARQIKPFWLFRHDLKIFQQPQRVRSGELTRRASVLWNTLGDPLHRYYKLLARYYKELLAERKRASEENYLYVQSNKENLPDIMNFTYNSNISDCFSKFIRTWDGLVNAIVQPDSLVCPVCSYFEEGSRSWEVISKCYALGVMEGGSERRAILCQQCSTLREEFRRLVSRHASVYAKVDRLISLREHEEFVTFFLGDLAIDVIGEGVRADTGQIMVVLSCCYRAGMLWGLNEIAKSDIERQARYTDDILKSAYQWGGLFTVLERRKSSLLQDLLNQFKFFLSSSYACNNQIPGRAMGVKKIIYDGSEEAAEKDIVDKKRGGLSPGLS